MKAQFLELSDELITFARKFRSGTLMTWLIVFLVIDATAIVTDLVTTLLKEINPDLPYGLLWWFRLDTEWYVWSTYGYLKLILISAALLICTLRTRLSSFLFLFLAYAYTTIDDMFLVHERAGRKLGSVLDIPNVIGETTYFLGVGVTIVALLGFAVIRAVPKYRLETILLSLGLLAIGFCAVFINLIEGFFAGTYRATAHLIGIVDDGGELVFSSLMVVLALMVLGNVNRAFYGIEKREVLAR